MQSRSVTLIFILCGMLFAGNCTPQAKNDRYQLGLRMRLLERIRDAKSGDAAILKRATPKINQAIQAFFTFQLPAAAQALDEACFTMEDPLPPRTTTRFAASLAMTPEYRLIDPKEHKQLRVTLSSFYKVNAPLPDFAKSQVEFCIGQDGTCMVESQVVPFDKFPFSAPIDVAHLSGDYRLMSILTSPNLPIEGNFSQYVSFVPNLKKRLEALHNKLAEYDKNPQKYSDKRLPLHAATLRDNLHILTELAAGKTLETDYHAAKLMEDAEGIAKGLHEGYTYYGGRHHVSFRWAFPTTKGRDIPARVLIPEKVLLLSDLPLVIALHGAGGSENLFFDGYGNGKIVELCAERGWLLVAPRTELTGASIGEIIDAIDSLYKVDRKHIFIVGHSMGAMTAVNIAQNNPKLFAGLAALGGGGFVSKAEAFKALPVFIGAGEQDFALGMAQSLKEALSKSTVKPTFKQYPNAEHLTVVQDALLDVFAFFDKLAK